MCLPPYADASLSAFGETAVAADDTASLMLHGAAAFGADTFLFRNRTFNTLHRKLVKIITGY